MQFHPFTGVTFGLTPIDGRPKFRSRNHTFLHKTLNSIYTHKTNEIIIILENVADAAFKFDGNTPAIITILRILIALYESSERLFRLQCRPQSHLWLQYRPQILKWGSEPPSKSNYTRLKHTIRKTKPDYLQINKYLIMVTLILSNI